jgi:hypothetical protein
MQRQQRDVKVGGYLNERVRITRDTVPQDERGTYAIRLVIRYRTIGTALAYRTVRYPVCTQYGKAYPVKPCEL